MQTNRAHVTGEVAAPSLRESLRHSAIRTLRLTGRLSAARRAIAGRGDIVVLTLHRVIPDGAIGFCRSPRGMVLRESLFIQLVEYLRQNATVICPQQAGSLPVNGPRPRVLLTFDDGWIDNALVAKPILAEAGMKACFFVVTELAGTIAPFWPEQMTMLLKRLRMEGRLALLQPLLHERRDGRDIPQLPCEDEVILTWLKTFHSDQLADFMGRASSLLADCGVSKCTTACEDPKERLMTWEQVEDLVSAGHMVGSHTKTHALLPLLDRRSLIDELQGSRRLLQERLPGGHTDHVWLSYPNGSVNPMVMLAAFEAGYRNAFSTAIGTWGRSSNPLQIPRVNVWDGSLTDADGHFCPDHADYALFWRSGYERS